eukprot:CAMPEP_0198110436 /NCGR_PEP_ID=MMETSP1442-20131203/2462_1 /TAXON_ID= /ORGANISM="Craspedostauros australis, Strain CCMP3328" /LENGTH=578 /DNA_ID=CAMNT_0043766503 /DNA_START=91 /DNA_END=1824 /DNA_ORIENTATION=-
MSRRTSNLSRNLQIRATGSTVTSAAIAIDTARHSTKEKCATQGSRRTNADIDITSIKSNQRTTTSSSCGTCQKQSTISRCNHCNHGHVANTSTNTNINSSRNANHREESSMLEPSPIGCESVKGVSFVGITETFRSSEQMHEIQNFLSDIFVSSSVSSSASSTTATLSPTAGVVVHGRRPSQSSQTSQISQTLPTTTTKALHLSHLPPLSPLSPSLAQHHHPHQQHHQQHHQQRTQQTQQTQHLSRQYLCFDGQPSLAAHDRHHCSLVDVAIPLQELPSSCQPSPIKKARGSDLMPVPTRFHFETLQLEDWDDAGEESWLDDIPIDTDTSPENTHGCHHGLEQPQSQTPSLLKRSADPTHLYSFVDNSIITSIRGAPCQVETFPQEIVEATGRTSTRAPTPTQRSPRKRMRSAPPTKSIKFRQYQSDQWNARYDELVAFHKQHRHCIVEPKDDKTLSHWVKRQRYQHKQKNEGQRSTLTDERQRKLERLGFVWDSHGEAWEKRFNDLMTYRDKHGHTNVPTQCDENPSLGIWAKAQRRQYRLHSNGQKSTLTDSRIERLSAVDFPWLARPHQSMPSAQ